MGLERFAIHNTNVFRLEPDPRQVGRLHAVARCSQCRAEMPIGIAPNVPPEAAARKLQAHGWECDSEGRHARCPSCLTRARADRKRRSVGGATIGDVTMVPPEVREAIERAYAKTDVDAVLARGTQLTIVETTPTADGETKPSREEEGKTMAGNGAPQARDKDGITARAFTFTFHKKYPQPPGYSVRITNVPGNIGKIAWAAAEVSFFAVKITDGKEKRMQTFKSYRAASLLCWKDAGKTPPWALPNAAPERSRGIPASTIATVLSATHEEPALDSIGDGGVRVSFVLPADLHAKIRAAAAEDMRSIGGQIMWIVREHLAEEG